jgi:hypothetical protein
LLNTSKIDVENVKAIMCKEYQFKKKRVKEWNEKAHMMKREAKKKRPNECCVKKNKNDPKKKD